MLTGKYRPGAAPPPGSRASEDSGKQFVSRYMTEEHLARAQRLAEVAARHGYDATQVALAFCLRNEGVSSVLVGAKGQAQLEHNLSAVDVTLSTECAAELEEIFPA